MSLAACAAEGWINVHPESSPERSPRPVDEVVASLLESKGMAVSSKLERPLLDPLTADLILAKVFGGRAANPLLADSVRRRIVNILRSLQESYGKTKRSRVMRLR